MARNRSEKPSADPRVRAMQAFAKEILATKERRHSGHAFSHGLYEIWTSLDDETHKQIKTNCGTTASYDQMAAYVMSEYGAGHAT